MFCQEILGFKLRSFVPEENLSKKLTLQLLHVSLALGHACLLVLQLGHLGLILLIRFGRNLRTKPNSVTFKLVIANLWL
jgi:hypothetical protein